MSGIYEAFKLNSRTGVSDPNVNNQFESTFEFDPPMSDFYDERSILGRGAFGVTHRMRNSGDNVVYAVIMLKLIVL